MPNTTIQLKKSSTPGTQPSDLANGEIALNFADGRLWFKNTTNQMAFFSANSGGGGPSFSTINVNGTLIVAAAVNDILNLQPGANISITGNATTDTITISAGGGLIGPMGPTGATGPMGPKSVTIPIPQANDEYILFYSTQQLNVIHVASVTRTTNVQRPPLVNSSIFFGANRASGTIIKNNMITTNIYFANTETSFDSTLITSNSFVWMKINSVSNTPTELHTTISFS